MAEVACLLLQIPPPILFDSDVLELFHGYFTLLSEVLHMYLVVLKIKVKFNQRYPIKFG